MNRVSSDDNEDLRFVIDTSGRVAVARCKGKVWPGPFMALLEQGLDACIEHGKRALLIDIRDCHGTAPSTAVRHEIGVSIAELQSGRSPLIILAVLGSEPFIDPGRFGEMVAVQNNAVFRAFTNEDRAHSWLESQAAVRETTELPPPG